MQGVNMLPSKHFALLVSALALVCCNSGEAEISPTIEGEYLGSPIEPRPDDVRFFRRPQLLARLRSEGGSLPEVVYIESDPWQSVIGSDSPRFALYDDGLTVYRDGDGFRSIRLNADELLALRVSLRDVHDPKLAGRYNAASATDEPDNNLLLYRNKPVFLSVYGSLDDPEATSRLPVLVRNAILNVRNFHHDESVDWLPDQLEVMIWPYEYAPEPSIAWKSEWPSLSDPSTVRRGDSYSLYLPSSELDELRTFLASRNSRGAILIDGRKWAASFRIPFPAEELWMAPNPEAGDTAD
jgi:hypothetical protein